MSSPFGDVISAYTRADALADGELVDVSDTAREAGFRCAVALTREVWARYVAVPAGCSGLQDETGRLWDVLWMLAVALRAARERTGRSLLYRLHVVQQRSHLAGVPPVVLLKAVGGPDDDGEPCLTVMLPEED